MILDNLIAEIDGVPILNRDIAQLLQIDLTARLRVTNIALQRLLLEARGQIAMQPSASGVLGNNGSANR